YLNRSFLGNRAYGVGAAAQVYYGKDLAQLSLPEMAMIAGLPQAPSAANPIRNPNRAMTRRNWVLGRMLEKRNITETQYQEAINAPITAKYHGAEIDLYAPYVSEMARDYMVNKYGEEDAYTNGYNVYTTISSDLQLKAQSALRDNVFAYDQRHGYRGAISTLWTDTPLATSDIIENLKTTSAVQGIIPAAVMSVSEQQATLLNTKGEEVVIQWNGLKWARKFINDRRQGKPPKTAADILTVGEKVWIRDNGEFWQLSQIPQVSSATVSLEPSDGAIRTLVGGFSFSQSQYNRVTQAKRQLGSNIKPFIYAAALEKDYTLATLINNAPINKPDTRQGTAWRPKNSPDIYGGPTRLRIGLAQSINVMSVRTMRHIGLDNTIDTLVDFGFDPADLPRNESVALGSPSVTPLQVATAFNVFTNGGYLVEPYYISKVTDSYDNVIEKASPALACTPDVNEVDDATNKTTNSIDDPFAAMANEFVSSQQAPVETENSLDNTLASAETSSNISDTGIAACGDENARYAPRIISEQTAFLITEALKSVIWGGGNWSKGTGWNGTAWRASRLIKRRDIAGKTGTTNESRDTWFSGFNPTLTSTFWVGFDDHSRKLGRTSWVADGPENQISGAEAGAKTAGPGWNDFMNQALTGTEEVASIPPKGIISARIDLASGKLTRKTDYTTSFEYFIEGTEPTEYATEEVIEDDLFIENPADDLFQ
ncbi:penicillin-binding protein 1A, partial [Pseudomonadota bacterium]